MKKSKKQKKLQNKKRTDIKTNKKLEKTKTQKNIKKIPKIEKNNENFFQNIYDEIETIENNRAGENQTNTIDENITVINQTDRENISTMSTENSNITVIDNNQAMEQTNPTQTRRTHHAPIKCQPRIRAWHQCAHMPSPAH